MAVAAAMVCVCDKCHEDKYSSIRRLESDRGGTGLIIYREFRGGL